MTSKPLALSERLTNCVGQPPILSRAPFGFGPASPPPRQSQTYRRAVETGGMPLGGIRHWQPVAASGSRGPGGRGRRRSRAA
jgi:hypothetical protein